jgi:single-strand DNA-binding protein
MNETLVTLQGRLGSNVTTRVAGDALVASFRLASNPRHYHRKTDEWVDGETQWYTVKAWRSLGENCDRSLRRGDPVVVHGRLTASPWQSAEGVPMVSFEIQASFVGHDLHRGTTMFTRTPRATPEPAERPAEPVGEEVAA